MSDLMELRLAAHEVFGEALRAVGPMAAINENVRVEESRLVVCGAELKLSPALDVFGVAIGKAAERMAYAVEKLFGNDFLAGVLSGPQHGWGWDGR